MSAGLTEFKGNKMIQLRRSNDDRYPFQFGLSKAKLVLDHIDEIEKFVRGEEFKNETEEKTDEEIKKAEKDGEFI